ncbi:MAG: hypothetical protein MUD10_02935 [Candidatus Pacebacteria bacterium]|jgi:hypothetical protein|nr:hypothetical protein [Candidatus Paceibacterota bacterium]
MVVFKQGGIIGSLGPKKIGLVLMLIAAAVIFVAAAGLIGRPASELKPAGNPETEVSRGNTGTIAPAVEEGSPADQASEPENEAATSTEETATTSVTAEEQKETAASGGAVVPEQKPVAPAPAKPAVVTPSKTTSAVSNTPAKTATPVDPKLASARDEQRGTDMRRISAAQRFWYTDHEKYYPARGIPLAIGSMSLKVADPINAGSVCGRDYVYCGLDNTANIAKFCYYAKLEAGGYYAVSDSGNATISFAPISLDNCADLVVAANKPKVVEEILPSTPKERDIARKAAMAQLIVAQNAWFNLKGKYFTCGPNGGDCGGNSRSYPAAMGFAMTKTPVDPTNTGTVCGRDYVYCGLDNTANTAKFCYYAKLETGRYYTAVNGSNFERDSAPATFAECAQAK